MLSFNVSRAGEPFFLTSIVDEKLYSMSSVSSIQRLNMAFFHQLDSSSKLFNQYTTLDGRWAIAPPGIQQDLKIRSYSHLINEA